MIQQASKAMARHEDIPLIPETVSDISTASLISSRVAPAFFAIGTCHLIDSASPSDDLIPI
jgi:hypothetical protein